MWAATWLIQRPKTALGGGGEKKVKEEEKEKEEEVSERLATLHNINNTENKIHFISDSALENFG
jgi:hypothetical protein